MAPIAFKFAVNIELIFPAGVAVIALCEIRPTSASPSSAVTLIVYFAEIEAVPRRRKDAKGRYTSRRITAPPPVVVVVVDEKLELSVASTIEASTDVRFAIICSMAAVTFGSDMKAKMTAESTSMLISPVSDASTGSVVVTLVVEAVDDVAVADVAVAVVYVAVGQAPLPGMNGPLRKMWPLEPPPAKQMPPILPAVSLQPMSGAEVPSEKLLPS